MSNKKFASGAFTFTRARGLEPKRPEDIIPLAEKHGFSESIIPPYAGDRAAIGRAIQATSCGLYREGFLLRPIRRTSTEVVYGIVAERKNDAEEKLDHEHMATIVWRAEPDSSVVVGDHAIARRVAENFEKLRGKLVAEDWSATVTRELENLGAVPFREDGRIYYCPPQHLDTVARFGKFLGEVGVTLVMAEIESETMPVVTEVVTENMSDQLDKLAAEVAQFDGKQKPSTYKRRLSEYQQLRERAILYRDALGVGVEKTEVALEELEHKVSSMLDLRQQTVVRRDGSVDGPAKKTKPQRKKRKAEKLTFAGAEFVKAESDTPDELVFVSGDEMAKGAVAGLEAMGLTDQWQQAGSGVEVSIRNSGPKGAETSIRLKLPEDMTVKKAGTALGALGIGVG